MLILNSQAKVYYGMHFYPGVAEYEEEGKEPFRIFINDATIRKMGPSFAGRPVFVEHVDEVNGKPLSDQKAQDVRNEADGWVIESFFNQADGKHWVKFISVTDKCEKAIQNGFRLSNAYHPTGLLNHSGLWNGVEYQQTVTDGEFDHLAVVRNPRYEESIILTPEQFKKYNDDKLEELTLLANSKDPKGEPKVKFNVFKRTKAENAIDPELIVVLPKSGKEISIVSLITNADEMAEKEKKNEVMADPKHMVKMDDGSMKNVGDLMKEHKEMSEKLDSMDNEEELETEEVDPDVESTTDNDEEDGDSDGMGGDPATENEEDEDDGEKKPPAKKNGKKKAVKKSTKNAADDSEEDDLDEDVDGALDDDDFESGIQNEAVRKKAAKAKADRLRNARERAQAGGEERLTANLSSDAVARGKELFGA